MASAARALTLAPWVLSPPSCLASLSNPAKDMKHEPTVHVYYADRTIDVKDGLPKFKDMPAEFGGSGDMLTE